MRYEIEYDQNGLDPFKEFDMVGTLVIPAHAYTRRCDYMESYPHTVYDWMLDMASEYTDVETPALRRALNIASGMEHYGLHGIDFAVARADAEALIEHTFDRYFIAIPANYVEPGAVYYVSREQALKEYNRTRLTAALRRRVEQLLQSELDEYYAYLNGDVYGYVVYDDNNEHYDSCYGFYGESGRRYAEEQAEQIIEHAKKEATI